MHRRWKLAYPLSIVLAALGSAAGSWPSAVAATPPAAAPPAASGSAATPPEAETEGAPAAPTTKKKQAARPAIDPDATLPFRLGTFYTHAFGQNGNLTRFILGNGGEGATLPSPAALGVDLGIGLGSHVRYHFGVGLEWESQGNYAAKGFRFDPIALGFPILVWRNDTIAIHVEPIVHLVRGEILFQSQPMTNNSSLFRIESGLAAAATVAVKHWFFGIEPLSLDFRVFEANSQWVHTGFSRLFWFQVAAGYEF